MLATSQTLTNILLLGCKIGCGWALCFSLLLWNLSERDIGLWDFLAFLTPIGCGFFTSVCLFWEVIGLWQTRSEKAQVSWSEESQQA